MNAISTVGLVLDTYLSLFRAKISNIKLVYDEALTYETSISRWRTKNNMYCSKIETYPLFSFKRSVLKHVDAAMGHRAITERVKNKINDTKTEIYKALHAYTTLSFLYITETIEEVETFEVMYLSEDGISSIRAFSVDFSPLGEFIYYTTPKELADKTFESENNCYKMLAGEIDIRGYFPVLQRTGKHIFEIEAKIKNFWNSVLSTITINN